MISAKKEITRSDLNRLFYDGDIDWFGPAEDKEKLNEILGKKA